MPLSTQNDSGQSGQAVITEENGQLRVVITLTGSPPDSTQPAHIHLGSCPTPGQVQYPLTSLQNGQSETVINSTWSALKSQAMAVNVHKSASEATVYVACGNI
ncbi:hypothetical protein A2899_00710 [Candidatus Amesbacteria bacterium RIFCSPLOWO2_01_FULL_49_25]|uniref:CHRD domain-containing protein n=1 Tax=Candidatus Amesbacteria bacterium RIFCSPHIGHO2_01_FULL_48_32b TaxID=1797253 RepID=A0A1F4YCR9_9BACT|nr:MAG: hypothetical protein A2876_01535 [Candidatus Amesbacteria bacterium RIFCSPHIGHO2_01_FULL_48_32b]OGD08055.1 MAG: hypothetical protein A2899_00710 [Candidatus Amesbacteria bacterium RIFCSPLOWO2_01_FULL_49_25]